MDFNIDATISSDVYLFSFNFKRRKQRRRRTANSEFVNRLQFNLSATNRKHVSIFGINILYAACYVLPEGRSEEDVIVRSG